MTWHNVMKSSKLKPGKKKMMTVKGKMVMVGRQGTALFATEALCRHMRWPLAWGAKVEDDCVRCPLHQTTHNLNDGSLVEWSPFPLFLRTANSWALCRRRKTCEFTRSENRMG